MPLDASSIAPNDVPAPVRRVYTETEVYPASVLMDLILLLMGEKRTGSLTINFAGGKPDGTAEWKQSARQPAASM